MPMILDEKVLIREELEKLLRKTAEDGGTFDSIARQVRHLHEQIKSESNLPPSNPSTWFKQISKGLKVEPILRDDAFTKSMKVAADASITARRISADFHLINLAELDRHDPADAKLAALKAESNAITNKASAAEQRFIALEEKAAKFHNLCVQFPHAFEPFIPWHAQTTKKKTTTKGTE